MDLVNYGASIITEEDRLSNLPEDIIHHILSFLDLSYAVQTSTLSRKWKHIWTSVPRLNFNSDTFCSLHRFGKFVVHALSHRNSLTEISAVTLEFRGSMTRPFVADIVNYAYLRNLRQLTICYNGTQHELPQCLFVSQTLKHLNLCNLYSNSKSCTPNTAWDFPALETLKLMCVQLGDGSEKHLNLFSKCVNLKDVHLGLCSMKGLEVFKVCAPQLSNFTITEASVLPKVVNMVTPQLVTLTASASVATCSEGLASCSIFLRLSIEGVGALEKVNISMSNSRLKKERHVPSLLDLFRVLRTVKYLILDVAVIESLSSCLDQLSHEPCPFNNLECLKVDATILKQRDCIPTIPTQVRKYFLENSPNATFIMDLPKVHSDTGKMAEEKRLTQEYTQWLGPLFTQKKAKISVQSQDNKHQMAKIQMLDPLTELQKAKVQEQLAEQHKANVQEQFQLNGHQMAKIQWQDQLIAQQIQSMQHEKLTSQIIKCKMADLKVQVESGNPDYEVIDSVGRDIKSALDLMPMGLRVHLEAEFSFQYEMLKSHFLTRIDSSQWERIEAGLGIIRLFERFHASHSQSHVHAAEPPAAPRVAPANMTAFSRISVAGCYMVVEPLQSSRI